MKSYQTQHTQQSMPIHDYSNAIQGAVSWLGPRYLLAAPISPRRPRPSTVAWYLASDPWLDARKSRRS